MVLQYKCPNCGNDMRFDTESGKLSCDSCGHKDDIELLSEDLIQEVFSDEEAKEYNCNNCGGTVITDADTTATSCSFCGASVVLNDRLSGALMPAKVIPFTISKEQARAAFKKWCKSGLLTPKGFMTANRIKEITGMYVPFWLYDIESNAKVRAKATKLRYYSRGEYDYTETKHYEVYRDVDVGHLKVPVDASEKMNDEIMDKVEPYNYEELKQFKTPYLAGYLAEKYNYDAKELFPRVQTKVNGYVESYVRSTITGYSSVNYLDKQIDTQKRKSYYALFPIWMVYYDFDKTQHTFAMNGQTGKIVGKPPISKGKVFAWFSGIAGSSFILFRIITFLMGGGLI